MTILRLRTEVADERGSLGRVASAIATCGGNILGVDVHLLDGARVADEFVIEFGEGGAADALAVALRRAGGALVEVQRLDEHQLVDPVARTIDLAALLAARPDDAALAATVAQLVRADAARLVDRPPSLHPAADHAVPFVSREARWFLAVPDPGTPRPRWLLLERASPAFSSSEIARVAAILRLRAAMAAPTPTVAPRAARPVSTLVSRRRASFFSQRSRPLSSPA